MNRSLRSVIASILLLALIGAGFSSGKAIGHRLRPRSDASLAPWVPGSSSEVVDESTPSASPREIFASVLDKVQQDYVGSTGAAPISNDRLTEGALSRMVASLQDPHTVYLDTSQTESRVNTILGRPSGIGADLTIVTSKSSSDDLNESFLTVKSVAPGTPAERAGLRTGDHITELNGQWIIAYPVLSDSARPLSESSDKKHDGLTQGSASQIKPGITAARAIQVLDSATNRSVHLTVARPGRKTPTSMDIAVGQIIEPDLEHKSLARGVMYMRPAGFNTDVASAIDAALSRQQDWAVGLIIDLRQNSGGVEAEQGSRLDGYHCALDLIGHIAQEPTVGEIERKPGVRTPIVVNAMRPEANRRTRVAVLVDGGTSNIAEMAAAGMRDSGGARLIGSHTFGDGVLQYLSALKSGGALELASAHLLTVGGVDLSAGVSPDIPVEPAARIGAYDDPALLRAIEFVSRQ